jgi:hypothetical protein
MRKIFLIISLLLVTGAVRAEKSVVTASSVAHPALKPSSQQKPSAAAKPSTQAITAPSLVTGKQTHASVLAFQSLAQLDQMVALGMSSLAIKLLDQEQNRLPAYSPDWYAFEYKRIVLFANSGRWQQLLDSSNAFLRKAIPGQQITPRIRQWFVSQQVVAHLHLKQPEIALQKARSLLWNQPAGVDNSRVDMVLRQLIIRAYLQLDDVDDAQKALQKYQQDYANSKVADTEDWQLLQARVLIRTSRYQEAIALLKPVKGDIAKALAMLAAVRENPKAAYKIVKSAQQALDANAKRLLIKHPKATDKPPLSKAEAWAYNYVLYERARLMDFPGQSCIALENMLALGDYSNVLGVAKNVSADDLWDLYLRIGQSTGNKNNLLVGDDAGWNKLAKKIETKFPVHAEGLYAVLAFNAHDAKNREVAHRALVALIAKNKNGMAIVSQLYLRSKRIARLATVPAEVRFALVDYTIASGQINLAARVMLSLKEPPEDKNPFEWRMRKARVLVLEGDYDQGVEVLRKTIAKLKTMTPAMLDQYFQVVFDLQAVEQNEKALAMFGLIKHEWLNAEYERELYYWKAESNYALKRYAQSAWLYLMSARAVDPDMADQWSQSARYKAADALTKAKLFDDAYTMYDQLLTMTVSETRRVWIKQAMQHVELLRNADKNKHAVKS